jgi:hypothetical protein
MVRKHRGVRAGRGCQHKQKTEQNGPHRNSVWTEADALMGPPSGAPVAGAAEVALGAATLNPDGAATGHTGAGARGDGGAGRDG